MRQVTFIVIITLFFNPVFCQEIVQIAHAFEPGRTYRFEVKRGKEDSDNPGSGRIFVVTSIEATVEKTDDSCLITPALSDLQSESLGKEFTVCFLSILSKRPINLA